MQTTGSALTVWVPAVHFKDGFHDNAAPGLLVVQAGDLGTVPRELPRPAAQPALTG
jgi:hypothetical protein